MTRIHGKLRGAWRRRRFAVHAAGTAWTLILLGPALVALLALDWMLILPLSARWTLLGLALAAIAWQLYRKWWRRLPGFDPLAWAVRVERAFPQLQSLLITYVELTRPVPAATGSTALFDVVRRQAESAASRLNFRETVDLAELKPLAHRAALALALVAAVAALAPAHARAGAKRYLGYPVGYPTDTRFESVPGDKAVGQGASLTLAARVEGRVPARGKVWVRPEGGSWRSVSLERREKDRFVYRVDRAEVSFDFYYAIGDARSHRRGEYGEVTVVAPPRLASQRVTVRPPEYTRLESFELDSLAGSVPEGSSLDVTIGLSRPLESAALLGPNRDAIPGELSDDGRAASFSLSPEESRVYRFRMTGAKRGMTFTGKPYRLRLTPDKPPTVSLVKPKGDIKATVKKKLDLVVEAADDYGLKRMAILFRVNGETSAHRIDLGAPPAPEGERDLPRSGRWPVSWRMRQDIPQLEPGDRVHLSVEVTEVAADPEATRTARSQEREVRILSLPAYQQHIVEKLERLRSQVGDAEKTERMIRHEVESIRKREGEQ